MNNVFAIISSLAIVVGCVKMVDKFSAFTKKNDEIIHQLKRDNRKLSCKLTKTKRETNNRINDINGRIDEIDVKVNEIGNGIDGRIDGKINEINTKIQETKTDFSDRITTSQQLIQDLRRLFEQYNAAQRVLSSPPP
jgi:uncharacterized coiled-coil DUF342 family protein